MTPTNRSIRTVNDDDISLIDVEDAPLLIAAPIPNADLYSMTPPVYTQSIADGEVSVDAEAEQQEKPHAFERSPQREVPPRRPLQRQGSNAPSDSNLQREVSITPSEHYAPSNRPLQHEEPESSQARAQSNHSPRYSVNPPGYGHYLTEVVDDANLVGAIACSILHDRPAIWLVKKKKMALSPLAAAVLTTEGLIGPKDLDLISQHAGSRRDPTDPLSGVLLGVYDTVGEMMLGLVAGPVELGKQATPLLKRYESCQTENRGGIPVPVTSGDVKGVPHAAAQVAIGTGKGMGRIVTASLKSPMHIMNGITRGFHNLPKSYGESVREYENVTGMRSGFVVSAKGFGYGLGDGLKDLFVKPIAGAEENGIVGFGTGLMKGVGNAMFKPTAGACGLIGYSSVGIYKSIRNISATKQEDPAALVRRLGEAEYAEAADADKLYIVRVWCQTQMRVRLA